MSVNAKILALSGAAALLMALPSTVQAKDRAGSHFRITARVPVMCWVKPDRQIMVGEGVSGSVVEACNNPGGYSVTANYRQLAAGESAQMIYNDRPVRLASNGGQLLRRSNVATIKTVNYQFRDVSIETPLTVFLTIQPL